MHTIGASVTASRREEAFAPLPLKPTMADILASRLHVPCFGMPIASARHGVQCGKLARAAGCDDETILACLLHDVGLAVNRPDHGGWGAQLIEPYVSKRISRAIRFHQALRYYPYARVGYEFSGFIWFTPISLPLRARGLRISAHVRKDVRRKLSTAGICRYGSSRSLSAPLVFNGASYHDVRRSQLRTRHADRPRTVC